MFIRYTELQSISQDRLNDMRSTSLWIPNEVTKQGFKFAKDAPACNININKQNMSGSPWKNFFRMISVSFSISVFSLFTDTCTLLGTIKILYMSLFLLRA